MPAISVQQVPAAAMRMARPQREARLLTGYAAVLVALATITGLLIRWQPMPIYGAANFTQDVWYVVLFKVIGMLLIPGWWFYHSRYRFSDLQPRWRPTPVRILWTLAAFAVGFCLNTSYIKEVQTAIATGKFSGVPLRMMVAIVLPLISAAIPEEFYFRGLLQSRLEAVWQRKAAVVVSVALFTAWHLPTRFLLSKGVEGTAGNFLSVALGTGVPVFIVGLIFAVIYDRYRSLVPLIAAHWAIDLLPSVGSLFGITH